MNKDQGLNCRNSNISENSEILDYLKPQKITEKNLPTNFLLPEKAFLKTQNKTKTNKTPRKMIIYVLSSLFFSIKK